MGRLRAVLGALGGPSNPTPATTKDQRAVKTIGILGGMGPAATADLYLAIIGIFQRRYGAVHDDEFPRMLITSVPAPDVVEWQPDEAQLVAQLQQELKQLQARGADMVAMACNTVHVFYPALAESISIPLLHLPEEAVAVAASRGWRRVGVLGTSMTLRLGLYRQPLAARGIQALEPDPQQQEQLTGVILDRLGGAAPQDCRPRMVALIDALAQAGAQAVILGCTDLPGIVPDALSPLPLIDSTQVLAKAAVREALTSDRVSSQL